jgi:hydrogenase maturation factor HypE
MKDLILELTELANAYRNTLIREQKDATSEEAKKAIQSMIDEVNNTLDKVNAKYKTNH